MLATTIKTESETEYDNSRQITKFLRNKKVLKHLLINNPSYKINEDGSKFMISDHQT